MKSNELAGILSTLRESGAKLWLDGERLRYGGPEGVLTPELRNLLVEKKSELIELLHEMRADQDTKDHSISSVSRSKSLPLSYAQERLWFLGQLEPGGFNYNLVNARRIQSKLNCSVLEQCLNELVQS